MYEELTGELAAVTAKVNQIISSDPFPYEVRPQCLASAVRSYPVRGGKRLRPALLLWSCGALGGDPVQAEYAACAVEIFHSWTLVHDDIIDEDALRRGQPTTHIEIGDYAAKSYHKTELLNRKFGRDMAILCGDIQQAWAMDMLLRTREKGVEPSHVLALTDRLQKVNRKLISGEAMDVEFPMRDLESVTPEEVDQMISGKTSCLLKFAAQCGGAIALKTPSFGEGALAGLGEYAENLGIAFQLRDDYLGIYGDLKKFGKPLCSDFHEAKPTPVYLAAMRMLSGAGKKRLLELTGLPEYPQETVEGIRTILHDCGAEAWLLQRIAALTEKAYSGLKEIPENKYKKYLKDLLGYLLDRAV